MKKTITLLMSLLLVVSLHAQMRHSGYLNGTVMSPIQLPKMISGSDTRAAGDTLLYMPLLGYYVNPTDSAAFNIVTEDQDGLPPNNTGTDMDFGIYYSTDTTVNGSGQPSQDNFYHPWENPGAGDSTFFWYATSWFNPAGQANNWLMFGPITLPAAGGILMWYERCNPAYRDGYRVLATTSPSATVTYTDFIDAPFYTRTDAHPSPTYATDTTWVLKTVNIPPTYNGQSIYLAYNHNANDMDVLYLDEITVVEAPAAVAENNGVNAYLSQNIPNPFSKQTNINYSLTKPSKVRFDIYDVTGRKVLSVNEGSRPAGKHMISIDAKSFDAGVYFYTMTANDVVLTKRMIISK